MSRLSDETSLYTVCSRKLFSRTFQGESLRSVSTEVVQSLADMGFKVSAEELCEAEPACVYFSYTNVCSRV